MLPIGLLTDLVSSSLDEDAAALEAALRAAGAEVWPFAWDDPELDEDRFDALALVVIRSPWAYHDHAERYLQALDRMAERVVVLNDPAVVRWNVDKRYLADLAVAGIPVVPTRYLPPGTERPERWVAPDAEAQLGGPASSLVIKPTVSAGSKNTARYGIDDQAAMTSLIERIWALGKTAMVQPYLDAVDEQGETALVYIDGTFSHALRKGPLLALGASLVAGTFAPEDMSARTAGPAQRGVADAVLETVRRRFGSFPLYARVDLLDDASGRPVLLEAELNEPSLFHAHGPGSAERFASAIVARAARR